MSVFGKIKKAAKSTAKVATKTVTKVASNNLVKSMVKTGLAVTPAGQAIAVANKLGVDKLAKGALKGDLKGGFKDMAKTAISKNIPVKVTDLKKSIAPLKKNAKASLKTLSKAIGSPQGVTNVIGNARPSKQVIAVPKVIPSSPMDVTEPEYEPIEYDREITSVQIPAKSNMPVRHSIELSKANDDVVPVAPITVQRDVQNIKSLLDKILGFGV